MLTRWNDGWSDFDGLFASMERLRTQMDRLFEGALTGRPAVAGLWPRTNVADGGSSLVVTAEVPGLTERDFQLSLSQEVLTLSGERKVEPPAGYSTHRQERGSLRFSRSFTLPCRVDPERAQATVKDGILTVTLPKAADAMPRQIAVQAAS